MITVISERNEAFHHLCNAGQPRRVLYFIGLVFLEYQFAVAYLLRKKKNISCKIWQIHTNMWTIFKYRNIVSVPERDFLISSVLILIMLFWVTGQYRCSVSSFSISLEKQVSCDQSSYFVRRPNVCRISFKHCLWSHWPNFDENSHEAAWHWPFSSLYNIS